MVALILGFYPFFALSLAGKCTSLSFNPGFMLSLVLSDYWMVATKPSSYITQNTILGCSTLGRNRVTVGLDGSFGGCGMLGIERESDRDRQKERDIESN